MQMLAVIPRYTDNKVSAHGKINTEDLKKMGKNALIFFFAPLLLYLGQLTGALNDHVALNWQDIIPSATVIGGLEAYLISTFIDYLIKLNNVKK